MNECKEGRSMIKKKGDMGWQFESQGKGEKRPVNVVLLLVVKSFKQAWREKTTTTKTTHKTTDKQKRVVDVFLSCSFLLDSPVVVSQPCPALIAHHCMTSSHIRSYFMSWSTRWKSSKLVNDKQKITWKQEDIHKQQKRKEKKNKRRKQKQRKITNKCVRLFVCFWGKRGKGTENMIDTCLSLSARHGMWKHRESPQHNHKV